MTDRRMADVIPFPLKGRAPSPVTRPVPGEAEWGRAVAFADEAHQRALDNRRLAELSRDNFQEAAKKFAETQATAGEVRKAIGAASVDGLRDSAEKLRNTVDWMSSVLDELERRHNGEKS